MNHDTDSIAKSSSSSRARETPPRPTDGETCPSCTPGKATRWTQHPAVVPSGNPMYLCQNGHWWTAGRPRQDEKPDAGTAQGPETEPGSSPIDRVLDLFGAGEARP